MSRIRTDIEGLRGLAVLSVLIYHAFSFILPGGFVGVDIFFVISGYLITTVLCEELKSNNSVNIKNFYIRRIRRLLPAFVVVVGSAFIFGSFILFRHELRNLAQHIVSSSFFTLNFRLIRESNDYFNRVSELKPLLHLWSLSIEEQFYIFWPILLSLIFRSKKALVITFAILSVSFFFNIYWHESLPITVFYSPLSRIWELMLGALLALRKTKLTNNTWAAYLGLGLIVLSLLNASEFAFPGWQALLPTIGTYLLLASGPNNFVSNKILQQAPLGFFGKISYPLYLWHWPILAFAKILYGRKDLPLNFTVVCVSLSVVFAWLTYRYIEHPIRFGRWSKKPQPLYLFCIALVVLGLLGFQTQKIKREYHNLCGVDGDSIQIQNDKNETLNISCLTQQDKPCMKYLNTPTPVTNYCRIAQQDKEPSLLVLGDSHAASLYPGIADVAFQRGLNTMLIANAGCPTLLGTRAGLAPRDRDLCEQKTNEAYFSIKKVPSIKKIILAVRGTAYVSGTSFSQYDKTLDHLRIYGDKNILCAEADRACIFKTGLRKSIAELSRYNVEIAVLYQTPELDFNPVLCSQRRWNLPGQQCNLKKNKAFARQDAYRKLLKELQSEFSQVKFYDTFDLFCPSKYCLTKIDNQLLYSDSDHMSYFGGRWLAKNVLVDFLK